MRFDPSREISDAEMSETRRLVLWTSGVLMGAGGVCLIDRDWWLGAALLLFGFCAGVLAEKVMDDA